MKKKLYAIWGTYLRNLKLLGRQKQLLAAPLFLPVIVMFLTAVIMGAGGDQWPIGLINESRDPSAQTLQASIQQSRSNITPYYRIVETDLDSARALVREGRLQMLIRIPQDYALTREVSIETYNVNTDMMKNVRLRLEHSLLDELKDRDELWFIPHLKTEKPEDVWRVSFIAGSCVLLSLFMGAALIAANLFAFEHENRTRKEIFLTPLPLWTAGIGNLLASLTVTWLCSVPPLLLAVSVFRMKIHLVNLLQVYLFMMPVMIACSVFGMLIAFGLKNYRVLQPVILVTSIATFFGAGGFIGVSVLPPGSQLFAKYWVLSRVFEWFNPILHRFSSGLSLAQIMAITAIMTVSLLCIPAIYKGAAAARMSNGQ